MPEQSRKSAPTLVRLLTWWIGIACRKTHWTLVIAILLSISAFEYTVHHLGFNTNTNDMLSADLPFRQTYHRFEQGFPQYTNNILVVIDASSPELARDASKRLAAQLEARHDLFESVYLPRANAFMEEHALLYLDMEKLEDTASDLAAIQPFLGRLASDTSLRGLFFMLQEIVEAENTPDAVDVTPVLNPITAAIRAVMANTHAPVSWQELMQVSGGKAGKVSRQRQQFILLQPRMDFASILAAKPAMQAVRSAAASLHLDARHGVRVRLTGSVALSHDELVSVSKGAGMAALLALVMVGMLLTIGLGSFRLVVATLLCLITGLILTAGFAALAIGHLNLISVAFAVLYIGLGVDYAIHLCLRCRELEKYGEKTTSALWHAAHDVGASLVLCAVTTAVGFYCFVPTDYTGVSELGIISGSGMFISLIVTLTLLPAILCVWNHTPEVQRRQPIKASEAVAWRFPAIFAHGKRAVRIIALIAGLAAATLLLQARFDYNPVNLRDQGSESITTYKDLVASRNISPSSIMVLTSDAQKVHDYQRRLAHLDTVDEAISLFDFIPSDQDEKLALIDDMALMLGPETGAISRETPSLDEQLAAINQLEYALNTYITDISQTPLDDTALSRLNAFGQLHQTLHTFSHMLAGQTAKTQHAILTALQKDLLETLPATLAFLQTALNAAPVSRKNIPESLHQRWVSNNGVYRIEVTPREDIGGIDALRRFVAQVRTIAPDATGGPVFTLEAGDAVVRAFIQAFSIAFFLIFLLLLLLLRSLTDTLLIIFPLLLAGILTGAGAVLLDIPFNFANVIALPLLLGIGVDNGIHMVQRFRHMQARGKHRSRDLLASSTSKAVILSALTTICGFGSLSFSPHQGTASMGQLLTLGITIILICTLIILPAFLNWEPARKSSRISAPEAGDGPS